MNNFIDCLTYETALLDRLKIKLSKLKSDYGIVPSLVTILTSDNEASHIYIRNKTKKAKKLGINVSNYFIDNNQDSLNQLINKLNNNTEVNSILIQLPLGSNFDVEATLNLLEPKKDVDGLTFFNAGHLGIDQGFGFKERKSTVPCTALGILYILQQELIKDHKNNKDREYVKLLSGKKVTVIGKSRLVGLPLALLLLEQGSTVTVASSSTVNLVEECKGSDILVVAAGQPNLINKDHVAEGSIIIDVGINRSNLDKKRPDITGDVKIEPALLAKARGVTPVPLGVGKMTTTFLMYNTYKQTLNQHNLKDDSYDMFL